MAEQVERSSLGIIPSTPKCFYLRVTVLPAYVAAQMVANPARHIATWARGLRIPRVVLTGVYLPIQSNNHRADDLFGARHPGTYSFGSVLRSCRHPERFACWCE